MTPHSPSRGFLYSAPPTEDRTEQTSEADEAPTEAEMERRDEETAGAVDADPRSAPERERDAVMDADANWTGTVHADD